MKKHHKAEEEGTDAWLMTYADMITLLLCFFVILLSVSEPKQERFEQMKESMQSPFSKDENAIETPFITIFQQFQSFIEEHQLEQDVSVEQTEKGIVLELSSAAFYTSGSADFKPEAVPLLEGISTALLDFKYENYVIEVEGHTDDVPISTPRYPSNWELAGNRSTNIIRFFINKGLEKEKMRATAYADAHPKVPNLDEYGNPIEENREKNRRIVIKLERQMP